MLEFSAETLKELREENLQNIYGWLDWQVLEQPTRLQVPELTQEELQSIVKHSPRLKVSVARRRHRLLNGHHGFE